MSKYIVAITGASGVIYGIRLVEELLQRNFEIHLIASEPAYIVFGQELNWEFSRGYRETLIRYFDNSNLIVYDNTDIGAAIASGSFLTSGMVVIPGTMSTISALAHGNSKNLIERAADVILKEKRNLIVVPRETPLSTLHLRNMLALSEMGAHIIPAMPAFYQKPASIEDLVAFIVGKVLDAMHISHDLFERYQ